jgi:DNA-binding MarR family transcriptional regulator
MPERPRTRPNATGPGAGPNPAVGAVGRAGVHAVTGAAPGLDPDLCRIDAALLALRHLWSSPPAQRAGATGPIELSTVWIVDALARAAEVGASDLAVRDVAAALGVAHSTASRLLDRAVAAGMVTRARSAADGRSAACALSPQGRALAAESLAFRTGYLARLTAGWTADERVAFGDLLGRFAEAVVGQPPLPPPADP